MAPTLVHPEFKGDRNAKSMKQSCQESNPTEIGRSQTKKKPVYIRDAPYQAKKSPSQSLSKHKHN